jgi:hypothetical protein
MNTHPYLVVLTSPDFLVGTRVIPKKTQLDAVILAKTAISSKCWSDITIHKYRDDESIYLCYRAVNTLNQHLEKE